MAPRPADHLLHPLAIAAVATMAINDHVVKHWWPGWVSGKLSDVAGLVVLPLTLLALAEVARGRVLGRRALWVCVVISVVGYCLVEVWPPAELAWRWTWGALQWPFRAGWSAARGGAAPPILPVAATSDWTDLLVLPAAALAFVACGSRGSPPTGRV